MADKCHIENRFWVYLSSKLANSCEIWIEDEKAHEDTGDLPKGITFEHSRWRTAAIMKSFISISQLRITLFRSNLVGRSNLDSKDGHLTKKNRNLANSRLWLVAILEIVFFNISVPFWQICEKFGQQM